MMVSSALAESRTVEAKSVCSSSSGVSSNSSVNPITPFMGVRSSWLMLARNSLLARFADSAATLAFSSSVRVRRSAAARRLNDSASTCSSPTACPALICSGNWRSRSPRCNCAASSRRGRLTDLDVARVHRSASNTPHTPTLTRMLTHPAVNPRTAASSDRRASS